MPSRAARLNFPKSNKAQKADVQSNSYLDKNMLEFSFCLSRSCPLIPLFNSYVIKALRLKGKGGGHPNNNTILYSSKEIGFISGFISYSL